MPFKEVGGGLMCKLQLGCRAPGKNQAGWLLFCKHYGDLSLDEEVYIGLQEAHSPIRLGNSQEH